MDDKRTVKVTYLNEVTGQKYKLGIEARQSEKDLDVAWDRGLKSALLVTGWNRQDTSLRIGW